MKLNLNEYACYAIAIFFIASCEIINERSDGQTIRKCGYTCHPHKVEMVDVKNGICKCVVERPR